MFDPTIYENIKVVLEGEIYDLDLNGKVEVTNRKDIINLATMSRSFIIQFKLLEKRKDVFGEIHLHAGTEDLASEILQIENNNRPGCEILIKFYTEIKNPMLAKQLEDSLNEIWNFRPTIEQRLSYVYKKESDGTDSFLDEIILRFGRKIDEENINDLHELIEYTILSLHAISVEEVSH